MLSLTNDDLQKNISTPIQIHDFQRDREDIVLTLYYSDHSELLTLCR